MINCRSSRDADSNAIMSNVNASQKDSKTKLKDLYNNEKKTASIIDLLIKTSTLKKKKNINHS
jgi:cytidylate kinase